MNIGYFWESSCSSIAHSLAAWVTSHDVITDPHRAFKAVPRKWTAHHYRNNDSLYFTLSWCALFWNKFLDAIFIPYLCHFTVWISGQSRWDHIAKMASRIANGSLGVFSKIWVPKGSMRPRKCLICQFLKFQFSCLNAKITFV